MERTREGERKRTEKEDRREGGRDGGRVRDFLFESGGTEMKQSNGGAGRFVPAFKFVGLLVVEGYISLLMLYFLKGFGKIISENL